MRSERRGYRTAPAAPRRLPLAGAALGLGDPGEGLLDVLAAARPGDLAARFAANG